MSNAGWLGWLDIFVFVLGEEGRPGDAKLNGRDEEAFRCLEITDSLS